MLSARRTVGTGLSEVEASVGALLSQATYLLFFLDRDSSLDRRITALQEF